MTMSGLACSSVLLQIGPISLNRLSDIVVIRDSLLLNISLLCYLLKILGESLRIPGPNPTKKKSENVRNF